MIDLHLHTNASDGRCWPREVVSRAAAARLSVISVVDHDTFAAQAEVASAAAAAGLRAVPGIEITAVWEGLDVHLLGYYLDPASPLLARFLERQRDDRVRRVTTILRRLSELGVGVDIQDVFAPIGGPAPHAVGRPQVARALVQRGYAINAREAFDRYLAEGRPAYVPRIGVTPPEVARLIVEAGGIASLAHPGLLARDELIPGLVDAGMQAIEVHHPEHAPETVTHYRGMAERYGLAVTGGSDYHGEDAHDDTLGRVTLSPADFARLEAIPRKTWRPQSS